MRDKLWLLTVAGKAALITTGGIFALTFALTGSKNLATRGADEIFLIMALIPVVIAAWWMFRKLQLRCTRREAAAVATLVAVLTPVSVGAGMLFGELSGGLTEYVLGLLFPLVGAFVGVVVMTTLINFALSLLTLWMTRQIVKLQSAP